MSIKDLEFYMIVGACMATGWTGYLRFNILLREMATDNLKANKSKQ